MSRELCSLRHKAGLTENEVSLAMNIPIETVQFLEEATDEEILKYNAENK